jgi:hypothetical protein
MCRLWGYIADIAINYINKKMEGIMKKLFTQQFMGVLAGLASIILSITLYAYKSDQNNIETQIELEKEQRIKSDEEIKSNIIDCKVEFKEDIKQHKIQDNKQTELLIKYLDQRFDDMEKLIQANHD